MITLYLQAECFFTDLNTFGHFFQHLAWKLADTTTKISWPVTGSDEERAMCRAADEAFPRAGRLTCSCTRHLRATPRIT